MLRPLTVKDATGSKEYTNMRIKPSSPQQDTVTRHWVVHLHPKFLDLAIHERADISPMEASIVHLS
jgi:hypothetical protein